MAAALISHSCEAASSLYVSAIASLSTIPTLLPSAPSTPVLAMYTSNLFNAPISFDTLNLVLPDKSFLMLPPIYIPIPLKDIVQDLTYWQIFHVASFVFTVFILAWMLDSHHSDDDTEYMMIVKAPIECVPVPQQPQQQQPVVSLSPPLRTQRRRQTLETIATLINLEDLQKKARARSCKLRSRLPSVSHNVDSTPTLPTDVQGHLITPPSGKSTTLLKNLEKQKTHQRRRSLEDALIRRKLEEIAGYDADMQLKIEEADTWRKGSWKRSMLVGLRVPVGWTMG